MRKDIHQQVTETMLLDTHKISLIYDFWKFNNEDHYLHDVSEFSRKLIESDTIDAEYIRTWIPDLLRLVEFWEQKSFTELDDFYMKLLVDPSAGDQIDALLRFLYDIQSYEMVKYLLDKNVQHYKKEKIVSSTMTAFHEACIYGFSQVCSLYINQEQDVNEPFSLIYENCKTNKKETIRNLTALQLVCLWSKYFPKRLVSYAHTVRLLLNHGARVNMTSTELTTALHWTCRAQHTTPLAQDLIEFGAFLHARDRINLQPIHYACWSRNRALVELLLQKGVRLTDQDDLGRTPIHFLCMPAYVDAICANDQQQQYEIMKSLLANQQANAYAIDLTQMDNQGHTLLAYACVSQNLPLIELLLQHQPDLLNTATIVGQTPLMIAINEGFLTGVEHLLQRTDLKRNLTDRAGNTAVHHVCMCSNPVTRASLLRLVLDDQNGYFDLEKRNEMSHDPFMLCTIHQAVDLCTLLIERNVSVTKKDLHSRQPLHMACQMGNYELVALLLRSSLIQINAVDDCNRNCLFYAISSGNEKLLDLLIQNRVQIKIRDSVGDTPLHAAVQHRSNALELTRCLLKTQDGKDLVNEPAADQMQPLLLAASCKQADVIHLLLKNGAEVKAVDSEHHTALHLACKSGCMTSAFYLIEFGHLDVNALDCYRQTPIFHAYASNDFDLVQYLMSCGARIDLRDSQNYYPLHIGILLCNPEQEFQIKLVDLYQSQDKAVLDDQNNECQMAPLILAAMQGQLKLVEHLVVLAKVNIMATCSNGHTALHYACLIKNTRSQEIIEFLLANGCSYDKVDQPKGSFLYTITQHGDRQALMYFLDQWLKSKPDLNEFHYGASLLDLLFGRVQLRERDLDISHLRQLLEQGAQFYSSVLPVFPCPLINDCPQFYMILLEYNCPSIVDKTLFILHLLRSIAIHADNGFLFNRGTIELISVCDYFLRVVRLAHYYYRVDQLFSIIDKHFLPALHAEQASEQVHQLERQLNQLRSTPLKLSEIARKRIRAAVPVPSKQRFEQIGVPGHLQPFLVQTAF